QRVVLDIIPSARNTTHTPPRTKHPTVDERDVWAVITLLTNRHQFTVRNIAIINTPLELRARINNSLLNLPINRRSLGRHLSKPHIPSKITYLNMRVQKREHSRNAWAATLVERVHILLF